MDSGYSWMILAGAFINYFMVIGNAKTFGILYNEILETYDRDSGSTAFISSIQRFITAIVGPIAGFISVTYSFRGGTFVGGILAGIGMSASALSAQPEWLFLTYTTVLGIGFGMAFSPAVSIVNYYFDKRRAMANGIVSSSGGLGTLVFPALYRTLFDKYGLQGGLLILGAICLNMCVGATIYRQPRSLMISEQKFDTDTVQTNACRTFCTKISNHIVKLFATFKTITKSRLYLIYTAAFSCTVVALTTTFVIVPPHLRSHGVSNNDIVNMYLTIGGTELIARVGIGVILDLKYITPEHLFMLNYGISGIFSFLFPFFNYVPIFYIYCVIVGIFPGSMMSLMPLMLIPVSGLKHLPPAIALVLLCGYAASLVVVPFAGWLEDLTGNWTASFLVLGGIQILGAIFVFFGQCFCSQKSELNASKHTVTEINNGQIKPESIPMLDICNENK